MSGCFWNMYQPTPIPKIPMSTDNPASKRSAVISSLECAACVSAGAGSGAGSCDSPTGTVPTSECNPGGTVATTGSSVCSRTLTLRSVNTELSAYGTPMKPPTVESTASTINGTVINHGDSCGSPEP